VFTTRLGATFVRLKELVEPAIDLANEIDCMEAAIFMRVCVRFYAIVGGQETHEPIVRDH
jgi:hypothetical protein